MRALVVVVVVATAAAPAMAQGVWESQVQPHPKHDYGAATAGALDRDGFGAGVYGGLQRVRDGGDAWSAELELRTGRFRLTGAITRFDGVRAGDDRLPMSPLARAIDAGSDDRIPTLARLTFGIRLDEGGPTRVLVEAGLARAVMYADPVLDADPVGATAGVRIERVIARRMSALVEASALRFVADVHATHVRAGVRIGPVEASLRRLAFNEGPPLYGPELGLRF